MSYIIKEGANNPSLVVFLFDHYGTPEQAPLQGLEDVIGITFVFRRADKGAEAPADLIAAGGNYVDPEDVGTYQNAAQYLWAAGNTQNIGAGPVKFEIEVEWTEGQIEKFPNSGYFEFTIEPDLRGFETET